MKYLHNMKTVNYFDIKLTIEEHFKFLHTDPSGEVWASIKKPYIKNGIWAIPGDFDFKIVAEVDLEDMNWTETLMEV